MKRYIALQRSGSSPTSEYTHTLTIPLNYKDRPSIGALADLLNAEIEVRFYESKEVFYPARREEVHDA